MGNIDCRTVKQREMEQVGELKLDQRVTLKMNLVYPGTKEIQGDQELVDPETKRFATQQHTVLPKGPLDSTVGSSKKRKAKRSENEVEEFMNELNADNDYSKKQMKKLSKTCHPNTNKHTRVTREKPSYKQIQELERLMSEQERFMELNGVRLEQESSEKQSGQKQSTRHPLHSFKENRGSRSSFKPSILKRGQRMENQILVQDCDTIIRKEDQKIVSTTETSNLMNLIYHLQASNKSPVILTENNEIRGSPHNQSFEVEIFIDDQPNRVMIKRGDDLDHLMQQFIEKNELPEDIHEMLIETILTKLQAY